MSTDKYALEEVEPGTTGWNALLTANMQALDDNLHTYIEGTAGEALVAGEAVYLKSDGKYWKAKADSSSTLPALGLAVAAAAAAADVLVQRVGPVSNDGWTWATVGGYVYVSDAVAGALTQTAPTPPSKNDPVGIALGATSILLLVGAALPGAKISVNTLFAGALQLGGAGTAFGATAVADPAAITAASLTDSTGGSKDNVLSAVIGTADDTNINNNFAELAEEVNALRADVTAVRTQLAALLAALRVTAGAAVLSN